MTSSRVVIRGNFCPLRPKTKINTNTSQKISPGFISPWFVVPVLLILISVYIFCINNSATKGYKIRKIEKEITELKSENEKLRIKEAELKSLYRIEEVSRKLNMADTVEIGFIEEKSPVAMK
jgi:uncharacterized membrane protein (DUF106 family)